MASDASYSYKNSYSQKSRKPRIHSGIHETSSQRPTKPSIDEIRGAS
jgi:hypothetical protein